MKICCFQCKDKAHGYNLDWVSFLWNRWLTLVHFLSNRNLCFSRPMDIFVSLVQWKTVFLSDQWISSHHSSFQWESLFLLTNGNLCDSCQNETFIFPVQWNLCFSCHRLLLVLTLRLSAAVLMLLTRPVPKPVCRFLISECFSTRSAKWPSLASMDKNVQINWS